MSHRFFLFLAILSAIVFTSCEKEYDGDVNLPRHFTPGRINIATEETQATLVWAPSLFSAGSDVSYTVEVSTDASFPAGNTHSETVDTSMIVLTDDVLEVRTDYYARVKANATGSTAESGWEISSSFRITGEQIFETVQTSDIIDIAVILRWRSSPGLTKIVLTPAGGTSFEVALNAADLAALQKTISGLTPNTNYTAEIFAGNKNKGLVTFTTKPSLVGGNIVDLRGITGNPAILFDTLPDIPSGSTVLLKKGQTYNISSTTALSKSVTIMAGYDFSTEPAHIFMNSNFNIVAGSTIDSIVFRDVKLTSDSYSGKYIFNINAASTIGKIRFESCHAEIFRGICRLQSAVINVTDFQVENCIMDSISNYGVINVDNVNCKVENISIRNSTIYKAEKIIVSRQNSTSVLVENCTINEAPWGGNYLIDYSQSATNNVTGGVRVLNSIMGVGKPNSGNIEVRGIRVNASTVVDVVNTYHTADYVLQAVNPFPIPNIIPYSAASTALFQDPAGGDFTIIDNNFPGRNTAGDPRWRP